MEGKMGYYNSVEDALLRVDAVTFEQIVLRIIADKYDNPKNLSHNGKSAGIHKSRKGTPDIFFQTPDNNYVFVEITTQQKQLKNKILEDIKKCKQQAVTQKVKVKSIIYVCNSKFDISNLIEFNAECNKFCEEQDSFQLLGIDYLTNELVIKYQNLASEFLNISQLNGSIKLLEEYLKDNKYDVSQSHEFLARQNEVKAIKDSLDNVILLHGKAGCGKTRLAIETARILLAEKKISSSYIVRGSDTSLLFNDLNNITGNVVCILDDINRTPYLKDCILYAQAHKNIFFIATVRDYALDKVYSDLVRSELFKFVKFIEIKPLGREEQEIVINNVLHKSNNHAIKKIMRIASGNLRIAIMCAEVINKENATLNDIKDVLDRHFCRINEDLMELDKNKKIDDKTQKEYKIALLIVALKYRIIDVDNGINYIGVVELFGLTKEVFKEAMLYWENKEIINISKEGKVFEIADQILSNYLFYKFIFEDADVSGQEFFEIAFPKFRAEIVNMLSALIPIYGYADTPIEVLIKNLWETYKLKDNKATKQFVETFFALFPTEAIIYVKEKVDKEKNWDLSQVIFQSISTNYYKIGIDIILSLVEISNEKIDDTILKEIRESFIINDNHWFLQLQPQIYALTKLLDNCDSEPHKQLLLNIIEELLKFKFEYTTSEGMRAISFCTLKIKPSDSVYSMRKLLWMGLFKLYQEDYERLKVLKILKSNANNPISIKANNETAPIIQRDKQFIVDLIKTFTPITYQDKHFVKLFTECGCKNNDVFYNETLLALERNDTVFALSCAIHKRMTHENRNFELRNKKENIFSKIDNIDTIIRYFENEYFYFQTELNWLPYYTAYQFFCVVKDKWPDKYLITLTKVFEKMPNMIILDMLNIVRFAFELNFSTNDIYITLKESNVPEKNAWLLSFYEALCMERSQDISDDFYEECLNIIEAENFNGGHWDFYHLLAFEDYKSGFVLEVFNRFISAYDNDKKQNKTAIEIFYSLDWEGLGKHQLSIEKVESFFGDKVESVYYDTCFKLVGYNYSMVLNNFIEYIVTKNINYMYKYYELLFEDHSKWLKYDLLKKFPNQAQNLLNIFDAIYQKTDNSQRWKYFGSSFQISIDKMIDKHEYDVFVDLFIKKYKDVDDKYLYDLESLLHDSPSNWQNDFYLKLVNNNVSVEQFKKLRLFMPSHWSGSTANMYEKVITNRNNLLSVIPFTSKNLPYINVLREKTNNLKKWLPYYRLQELATEWN